jgi:hypothetical protein
MRYLLILLALFVSACGDDSGIASGGSGGGSIDAPVPDAPLPPDAPIDAAVILQMGDPCGAIPGSDGGVYAGTCMPGLLCCLDGQQLGAHHCRPPASTNDAGIGAGQCGLPDLVLDEERLRTEIGISMASFSATGCSVVEGCVNAAGARRLLHFSVVTPNVGTADLYLGVPSPSNPIFV